MQAKLLRILEEGELERVGGDRSIAVDARVIVATHCNLEELVKQGLFRQDLFHRVYVFPIELLPLRARREDIPPLVEHFAAQVAAQNNWKPTKFAPEALEALCNYRWPGNVRELRNIVERLLLLADGPVDIAMVALALPSNAAATAPGTDGISGTLSERVSEFERLTIMQELKRHGNHMTNTAKAMGLERSHLYKKCQQLNIDINRE